MLLEPVPPFLASHYRVKLAAEPWEWAGSEQLRRQVFCHEQKIFVGSDRDAIDAGATAIVAVTALAGTPNDVIGTVRIHEVEPDVWQGSRLAVDRTYRGIGSLGPSLIQTAVGSARARGCVRFLAYVQAQNETLFRRLHWQRIDERVLHGVPHVFMQADLEHYPPVEATAGFLVMTRKAA